MKQKPSADAEIHSVRRGKVEKQCSRAALTAGSVATTREVDCVESMTCRLCGGTKPLSAEFWRRHSGSKTGWRSQCKVCLKAKDADYRAANVEEIGRRHSEWRSQPKNRAKIAETGRAWGQDNPERARAKARRWRESNPLRARTVAENSRARRRSVPGELSGTDLLLKFREQQGRCRYCDKKIGRGRAGDWHVDHVVPISKGGTNHPDNIVVACSDCNLRKHNKMPWEFAPDRFSPPTQ